MKANKYLFDNGHIKAITRGRRSTENNRILAEAYANGVRFSDWEPKEGISKATGEKITLNAKSVVNDPEPSYDITYSFPEKEYRVFEWKNGKKVYRKGTYLGMREVCGNCKVSLVCCVCGNPRILADDGRLGFVPVVIEKR